MKTRLLIVPLIISLLIPQAFAIPFFTEEQKIAAGQFIAIAEITSYRDDGIYRFYDAKIIKWLKNPLEQDIVSFRSINEKGFETHTPKAIFEVGDYAVLNLRDYDRGFLESTFFSKKISKDEIESEIKRIDALVKSNVTPLKQIKSGIKYHNVECKDDLKLVYKQGAEKSACVTLDAKIELTVRGWAHDDRILLGCTGERVQKCYPEDKEEYRKALQHYYYGIELEPESILDSIFNSDIVLDSTAYLDSIINDDSIQIQITKETASQICKELKMNCPVDHFFSADYDPNTQIATFQQSVGLHIYDLTVSNNRICHTVDGDTQKYCSKLDVPYNPIFDGNMPTLLSKTAEQWQIMSDDELYSFYEKYGDEFYTELGKIILKNEIKNELKRQNIVNADDDFTLHVTGIDLSLPPTVYLQSVVNGTDGKGYQFNGSTHANQILSLSFEELKD